MHPVPGEMLSFHHIDVEEVTISGGREHFDSLYGGAVSVHWALRWLQLGPDLNLSFFGAEPN